ncbi:MAG: 5'-methylthioadenosine/adenosylhomocysteine nucleosidase [Clostridium sp.]|uniref:5'-methylthioadenosine/adenosylhomocysteine nucleosidase n=1 Tax=Clostridium sp. TaxID=1506 RepID=UPI003056DAB0
MRTIGIIGAMDVEIELIKSKVNIIEEIIYAGVKFYLGKYKNLSIVICSCGVGKVNAASCTQVLITKFNVTEIINTGIAGSLNTNVQICDVVISDNVTYHDVRKRQMKSLFPFQEEFKSCESLKDMAVKAYDISDLKKHNYHIGRIVTGESFVSDNEVKNVIIEEYNPLCVEMEGGAIGHVAHINNIPFLIIRSISDNADENATESYDNFESIAADNSAKLVMNMLELINNKCE